MKNQNHPYHITPILKPILLISSLALFMSACSYQPAAQNSAVSQHPTTSMIDSDGDGVHDDLDMCPSTSTNLVVDAKGCPVSTGFDENYLQMEVRVFYDEGSSEIKDEYLPEIDRAGDIMKERSDTKIQIEGHISQAENTPNNQTLAQARADGVKNHLIINYGIDAERIQTAAYGADRPIAPNDDPQGVELNQRVYALVESVDANDMDGDGVSNEVDKCPDTPPYRMVDADGCLPNISIMQ